jgi:hypothetical protein
VNIAAPLRRIDGMTIQALIAGSLSFAHIHELANTEGQTGWKGWMYPLSVDLLMVAAWGRLRRARISGEPTGWCWFWFFVALAASMSANIATCWPAPSPLKVAVAVWPAVAFLGTTLLGHATRPEPKVVPETVTEPEAAAALEPEVETVPEVEPQPEAQAQTVPEPEREPVDDLTQRRKSRRGSAGGGVPEEYVAEALGLLAKHDGKVSGAMVGEVIKKTDRYGRMVLEAARARAEAEARARAEVLPEAVPAASV